MPLIEHIVPSSERRVLLICALNDRVIAIAKTVYTMNPTYFGLYIYHGSNPSQDMLLHTIRRQYAHILQLDITSELDYSVYVETPALEMPLIKALINKPTICIRQNSMVQHVQINVSIANFDQTCMWLIPLLHHGTTGL
jgi:hypothetical protein